MKCLQTENIGRGAGRRRGGGNHSSRYSVYFFTVISTDRESFVWVF